MPSIVAAPAPYVALNALAFGATGGVATGVDHDQPLPVLSGAGGVVPATIAAGASIAPAVDLDRQRLHRIAIPAGWTAAALSFRSSGDGVAWFDLYDMAGEVTVPSAIAAAGRSVVLDPSVFFGVRFLQIRSGTAAAPVAQAAARTLLLVTVAR